MSKNGRGHLRIYLGAAPGVGKTYKMLGEGRRRHARGTDVVVGFVETHGRKYTEEMLGGMRDGAAPDHRSPRRQFHRDGSRRRPGPPTGGRPDRRAGAHQCAGQPEREALAGCRGVAGRGHRRDLDAQRAAHRVAQRRRGADHRGCAARDDPRPGAALGGSDRGRRSRPAGSPRPPGRGNVYPAARIDAALSNYFRLGNLTALRELALLWLADEVDSALKAYRAEHGIDSKWEARERVVVALTGGPEGETLIRRGARIAARAAGGDLLVVHVSRQDGLAETYPLRSRRSAP